MGGASRSHELEADGVFRTIYPTTQKTSGSSSAIDIAGTGVVTARGANHSAQGEVASGARIEASAVLDGCHVGDGAVICDAIISPDAEIGADARITEQSVVGPRVKVAAGGIVGGGAKLFASDEN